MVCANSTGMQAITRIRFRLTLRIQGKTSYLRPLKYLKMLIPRKICITSLANKKVTSSYITWGTYVEQSTGVDIDLVRVVLHAFVDDTELEGDNRVENEKAEQVLVA